MVFGSVKIPPGQAHVPKRAMHSRIIWIEGKGLIRKTKGRYPIFVLRVGYTNATIYDTI